MILFLFPAFWIWANWYNQLFSVFKQNSSSYPRLILKLVPILSAVVLFSVLRYFGASAIRHDPDMLFFYLFFGLTIIGTLQWVSPFLGLSMRDDVLERDNEGASYALSGAILGMTFCFAGANVGEGPGPVDVLFCLCLNLPVLILLWLVIELVGSLSDRITVEYDDAAGLRLGAFLTAAGLILGRAVAGPWVSEPATLSDFIRLGWPVLPLAIGCALVDSICKPTKERPIPSFWAWGILPAVTIFVLSVAYVSFRGPW